MIRLIAAIVALTACSSPTEQSEQLLDKACHVVLFTAADPLESVCAIRCSWRDGGFSNWSVGYSDTTPVPCSWAGRKISMENR